MTAETARKAIETLMGIIGEKYGVEIEMTMKEKKDNERLSD